ncbi:Uncharacterized protein SCF082_LOCUS50782 [Durusdinium trenchii]|uniref:Solute carrier family 40 protein n=1 Tax=Durusdinium trenchii TaxID=1381693 RepID=A0ABP0SAE6_9DINO
MSRTTGENALPLASAPALSSAPRPLRAAELPAELRAGPDLRRGTSPAPGERPRRERPRRATTGAILESAPNSLVQLYALVIWAIPGGIELEHAASLLRISVLCSFVSVGLGLAMWEQKVQFRTSSGYVAAVAIMRAFEIAARSATLAVFSGLTHPYGFFWSLAADYCIMLFLIVRHQSVQFTYGLFVALPLVLVSLEPLVWRREDHAVPKEPTWDGRRLETADSYYLVRVAEFVVMWMVIIHKQGQQAATSSAAESSVLGCEVLALFSMLGLFITLPFVWRVARQHELCRDVADWAEEGRMRRAVLRQCTRVIDGPKWDEVVLVTLGHPGTGV